MCVHLARASKDNAILVDHVNLARRCDGTQNLARASTRVIHLVEGHPGAHLFAASRLIKGKCRIPSNVEGSPVQDRLLLGLLNRDGRLVLHRESSTRPRKFTSHLKSTWSQTIRNIRQNHSRMIRVSSQISSTLGRCPRGRLHGLHSADRP